MRTVHWQVDSEGFRNQLDTSVADTALADRTSQPNRLGAIGREQMLYGFAQY
jgi:hypothetical protein